MLLRVILPCIVNTSDFETLSKSLLNILFHENKVLILLWGKTGSKRKHSFDFSGIRHFIPIKQSETSVRDGLDKLEMSSNGFNVLVHGQTSKEFHSGNVQKGSVFESR